MGVKPLRTSLKGGTPLLNFYTKCRECVGIGGAILVNFLLVRWSTTTLTMENPSIQLDFAINFSIFKYSLLTLFKHHVLSFLLSQSVTDLFASHIFL